jgi:hypothetical protein
MFDHEYQSVDLEKWLKQASSLKPQISMQWLVSWEARQRWEIYLPKLPSRRTSVLTDPIGRMKTFALPRGLTFPAMPVIVSLQDGAMCTTQSNRLNGAAQSLHRRQTSTLCLHFWFMAWFSFHTWRWRQRFRPKIWFTFTTKNGVFWDVTPCGSCKNRLRRVSRFLLTANFIPSSPILVTLMMEALSSSETSVLTEPHCVRSQKTPFFIVTAVKT